CWPTATSSPSATPASGSRQADLDPAHRWPAAPLRAQPNAAPAPLWPASRRPIVSGSVTDQLLRLLTGFLLVLLYLFFLRVLRAVWTEVNARPAVPAAQVPAVKRGRGRRDPRPGR